MRSFSKFNFPLIQQWPINCTSTEVGHVLVTVQAIDGGLQQLAVVPECRAVTWQEPFYAAGLDPFERQDECGNIGPVMTVDTTHAAVAENVVARKQ